jgi:hypothetical protein
MVASLRLIYQRGDGLSHQAALLLQIIVDLTPGKPFQITVEEKGMLPLRQIIIKFSRHLIL